MDKVKDGYRQVPLEKRGGLQEYDAVGTGCIVIARRVLETIKEPCSPKWENGLMILGRDFYMCEKAKKVGFKVWAHWDYLCDHFKELSLLSVINLVQKYGGR